MKNGPLFYITSNICLNIFGGWGRWKILWIYQQILKLKEKGLSNRSVAKSLGIDKKTVNKYWNEYKENLSKLDNETNSTNILRIQEDIVSKPKYNSVSRVRRKLTPDFFLSIRKYFKKMKKINVRFLEQINKL